MSTNVVWPYRPEEPLIETLMWKTNVFRTKSAEQRIALRETPRRELAMSHFFKSQAYSNAKILMRYAESFLIPDWTLSHRISSDSMGLLVPVLFPTDGMDLAVGGFMVLWQSSEVFEMVEIDSFDADGIVAVQVSDALGLIEVLPLLPALCMGGLSISRQIADIASGSVTMVTIDNQYIGATSYPQYRGHDIMQSRPIIDGGVDESVVWPVDTIDNDLGTPIQLRERFLPSEEFTLRWELADRASLRELREWFHSRKGKQIAFWISSWAEDFALAVDIGSSDTTITVFAPQDMTTIGRTAFDVNIQTSAGVHYFAQVTNCQLGTPVNGAVTFDLTISGSLGVSVPISSLDRISFIRCSRFNSDSIEIRHSSGDQSTVTIPCIEVPVP